MMRSSLVATLVLFLSSCQPGGGATSRSPESGPTCEANKTHLLDFLGRLPERTLLAPLSTALPESTLGGVPGTGHVLEIADSGLLLDGEPVRAASPSERVKLVRTWARDFGARSGERRPTVYLAVARDTDIRTVRAYLAALPEGLELSALVRTRAAPPDPDARGPAGFDLAAQVLSEDDFLKRKALARDGYEKLARCPTVTQTLDSVESADAQHRWPALKRALTQALPACDCRDLSPELENLLLAEQRAGTARLGSLPATFLRDERCGASMPLRSMGKLVGQMERFDQEFSGSWGEDALEFDEVVTNQRLLVYFCNALPGETLAAVAARQGALYLRIPGTGSCREYHFDPIAKGAPMGTLRGRAPTPWFHYWQAAEEIRIFGPLAPGSSSRPTDEVSYACDQNLKMQDVDDGSIGLEKGRFFFTEAACRAAAPEAAVVPGCVAEGSEAAPESEAPPPG